MHILFLYFSIHATVGINHGLAILTRLAKQAGHTVTLRVIVTEDYQAIIKPILDQECPDVIGLSVVETQQRYVRPCISWMATSGLYYIIVGGSYPTMNPYEVIQWQGVDAVCYGEGERAFLKYLEMIAQQDYESIPNLLVKHDTQKPLDCRLTDLSILPSEDLLAFPLDKILPLKNNQLEVSLGRGCPFRCAYCINGAFLDQYHLTAKQYVRIRNPVCVIEEIRACKKAYPQITEIAFIDDDFFGYASQYPKEMEYFYTQYQKEIHLPFIANVNPLSINAQRLLAFEVAGGKGVRIGIETSERLRRSVCNRTLLDDHILEKVKLLHEFEIEIGTYNMIGLPHETSTDVTEMLRLNAQICPEYVKVDTFFPFQGTPLYDLCVKEELLDETKHSQIDNYDSESALKWDESYRSYLRTIQSDFHIFLNEVQNKYIYEKLSRSVAKRCLKK